MKKTAKNLTTSTAQKKSKLDPLSNNNESNLTIDGVDDFVLFPLDVQETNPITQNTTTSQEDDFILFPLDVKKTSTNTNNPVPITNQKTNKPKKQFVTKPYPTNSNNSVNQTPNTPKKQIVAKQKPLIGKSQANPPTPALVNKPLSNKTKILWVFIICIGLYTYFKKESSETYGHFFYKTIKNVSISGYNQFVSLFKDEDDFKKFKLGHKIIYSPYLEYIEDESGEINEVKGDSIILLKPTGKQFRSYFLPSGKPYQIKLNDNEYSEKEHYSNENIYLNIDQESFESRNQNHGVFYSDKTNVVIDDERNYFTQEILVNISDIEYDYTNKVEYEYMRNDIHDFKLNITSKKYFFKNTIFPSIEIDSLTTKNKTRKIVKNSDINIKLYERKNVELDNEGWPINKGNLIIIKDFNYKNL